MTKPPSARLDRAAPLDPRRGHRGTLGPGVVRNDSFGQVDALDAGEILSIEHILKRYSAVVPCDADDLAGEAAWRLQCAHSRLGCR